MKNFHAKNKKQIFNETKILKKENFFIAVPGNIYQ